MAPAISNAETNVEARRYCICHENSVRSSIQSNRQKRPPRNSTTRITRWQIVAIIYMIHDGTTALGYDCNFGLYISSSWSSEWIWKRTVASGSGAIKWAAATYTPAISNQQLTRMTDGTVLGDVVWCLRFSSEYFFGPFQHPNLSSNLYTSSNCSLQCNAFTDYWKLVKVC